MPLDPRVQISGDPEEVWLLEWYRVNLRGPRVLQAEWLPADEEPFLLDLEMNIHKLNRCPRAPNTTRLQPTSSSRKRRFHGLDAVGP